MKLLDRLAILDATDLVKRTRKSFITPIVSDPMFHHRPFELILSDSSDLQTL